MIELEKSPGRWTITLNRPHKANALSLGMLETLNTMVADAAKTADLKALVFTGAGNRVFSAGADLTQAGAGVDITTNPVWEDLSGRIAALDCLTIAALNGTLAGGAFGMALACDLRLAVPSAKFFYPVLKNGFLPQPSDVKRMIDLIGPARTKLILLAGQKLTADQALDFGLIDVIAPDNKITSTLNDLIADAAGAAPAVLSAIKRSCTI